MPRINLLPWREQQRIERKKSFVVGMLVALLAAGVVTLGGYFLMNGLIIAQNKRNETLTAEIKELDKKIQEIERLEAEKEQFIGRLQVIEKLQRSRPEIVHIFDTLVQTVPEGIYLTSVVQNGQKFQIQGVMQAPSRISAFMRQLEDSGWFKDTFPQFEKSSFTLDAVQVTSLNDDVKPAAATGKKSGAKK